MSPLSIIRRFECGSSSVYTKIVVGYRFGREGPWETGKAQLDIGRIGSMDRSTLTQFLIHNRLLQPPVVAWRVALSTTQQVAPPPALPAG